MQKLGEKLLFFLEDESLETNNDVTKERFGAKQVKIQKPEIDALLQQLITISTEGLTIELSDNISNITSVAQTISGLAQDLQEKINKLKEDQHEE